MIKSSEAKCDISTLPDYVTFLLCPDTRKERGFLPTAKAEGFHLVKSVIIILKLAVTGKP